MSNPAMKQDELGEALARIAALEAENATLATASKAQATARLTCKVGAKGGVSLYGLGRFPVTLYASQWLRLAEYMPEIMAFCKAHATELAVKPAVK